MRSQLAVKIGHYWPILITGVFAAITAADITTIVSGHRMWSGAAVIAIPAIFATGYVSDRHDRTHCLRCARNIPLNASEVAAQRWRTLRIHHAMDSYRTWFVFVAAAIAALLLLPSSAGLCVTDSVWLVWFAALARSSSTHRLVQAWCPWCHRGDDGDDEVPVPEPDPTGQGSRHV